MKILHRERVPPIRLAPGDTLAVTYNEPGRTRTVTQTALVRNYTVDDVVIADLEQLELAALGLKDGLAVVLGETE